MSLPQAISGAINSWAETEEVVADPSKFVSNPKWEGTDKKIFEGMYVSKYKPLREVQKSVGSFVSKKAEEIIEDNKEWSNQFLLPSESTKLNQWLFEFGSGASSIALAVGTSIATGSPNAASILFGLMAKGSTYNEAKEAGVEPLKASAISNVAGVVEGSLEYLGLNFLLTKLPTSKIISMAVKGIENAGQEWAQESGGNLVAQLGWGKFGDWTNESLLTKFKMVNQNAARAAMFGLILGVGADTIISSVVKETNLPATFVKKYIDEARKQMPAIEQSINAKDIIKQTTSDPEIEAVLKEEIKTPVSPEIKQDIEQLRKDTFYESSIEINGKKVAIPKKPVKDMTKEEFKTWLNTEPESKKEIDITPKSQSKPPMTPTITPAEPLKKVEPVIEEKPKTAIRQPVPDEIDMKIRNILDKDKELLAITAEYNKTTKPNLLGSGDKSLLKKEADLYTEKYNKLLAKELKTEPPKTAIPKELEGLAEEARKYGSAEEFVKSQVGMDITYPTIRNKKVELIKNPSHIEIKDIKKEYRESAKIDYKGSPSFGEGIRDISDNLGNLYVWREDQATHGDIEKYLTEKDPNIIFHHLESMTIRDEEEYAESKQNKIKQLTNFYTQATAGVKAQGKGEASIPTTQKTTEQSSPVTEKTSTEPGPPQGTIPDTGATGEMAESKRAQRARTIYEQITGDIIDEDERVMYQKSVNVDDVAKTIDLFESNPELVTDSALGYVNTPTGYLSGHIRKVVEQDAIARDDIVLLNKLATAEPRSLEYTHMGKVLQSLKQENDFSPVAKIQELNKVFEEEYNKRKGNFKKDKQAETSNLDAEIKQLTTADDIIEWLRNNEC
jgi:hypothetical protein